MRKIISDRDWRTVCRHRAAFFKKHGPYIDIAVRDLFAVGCHLYQKGYRRPICRQDGEIGAKVCLAALRALHLPDGTLLRIIRKLESGRAVELAKAFQPHVEVDGLFPDNVWSRLSPLALAL